MPRLLPSLCLLFLLAISNSTLGENLRVYKDGAQPNDVRLQPLKDLNGYFPFDVPEGVAEWEARAEQLQKRILVATGLWPMPEKTPLNPVLHGLVKRDGFTVEKVYFESVPGHFVTGLLFRPENIKEGTKIPGVLCPHGHGGRLHHHDAKRIRQLIVDGNERFEKSGSWPKLAKCAQLARMGCTTFVFDMLGYADSVQISYELAHRFKEQRPDFEGTQSWGLFSTQAEMRLQNIMGLQTWNCIRGLDFLEQLPEVDSKRLAVTGGSGGGTQTILTCAIDPRPVVAFPQGMVSTSMQGGCTCENCCLLRIGTGNVELTALFAPKPQGMTAADDWTRDMMTKGYPTLQKLYALYDAKDKVYCRELLHFPHNYNYVTRATMYRWFNKHLGLGLEEPIVEEDFESLTPEEYTVWNDEHPKPEGGAEYERSLTKYLAEQSDKQMAAVAPTDADGLQKFREVVGGAYEVILRRKMPDHDAIQRTMVDKQKRGGYIYFEDILRLDPPGEEFPVISLYPTGTSWNGRVVVWVSGSGKKSMFDARGEVVSAVRRLLDAGVTVVAADLFQQGEFLTTGQTLGQQRVVSSPREFAGYTFGYNDPLFVRRVHDVLTLVSWIRHDEHAPKQVNMIGVEGGGLLAAAARVVAGKAIDRVAVDTQGFRFADLTSYRDPRFLPGVVKYGDLPAMLALSAPHPLWLGGESGKVPALVKQAYAAAGAEDAATSSPLQTTVDAAVDWLLE